MKRSPKAAALLERMCHAECILQNARDSLSPRWNAKRDLRSVTSLSAPPAPLRSDYEPPEARDMGKIWQYSERPKARPKACAASTTALHEAAHFVVAEQLMGPGAIIAGSLGLHRNSGAVRCSGPVRARYSGLGCVPLVAIYSAGVMGELVASGAAWNGPVICTPNDWSEAKAAIKAARIPEAKASGVHAYAQRLALTVLCAEWVRVREVAQILLSKGSYSLAIND